MMKNWLLLIILSLLLSVVAGACGQAGEKNFGREQVEKEEQVLNLLSSADLPTMDTTEADDSASFTAMNQVFEGLYRLGPDQKLVPGVAKALEKSEDGRVLTFHLHEKAKWSDGSPVTAHDFIFAWKKAIHPKTLSPYAYLFKPIQNAEAIMTKGNPLFGKVDVLGVKALNDKTLQVTLDIPVPYFLYLTAFPTFFPQKESFVKKTGSEYALYPDKMLYNGPFFMSKWTTSGWTFEKNRTYWDRDTVKLEKIHYKVMKDAASETNLFETGQVDRASVHAAFIDYYQNHPDFYTKRDPSMWFLKFNVDRIPLLQRKAIQRAINKEQLVENLLKNGSVKADYFFPEGFAFHPTSGEDFRAKYGNLVSYDVDEAKRYWKEAGSPKVTWELLISDQDQTKKIAEFIKNELETNLPGLTISINVQPFKQRLALDHAINYDIQLAGWGPDYQDPLTFMDLWVTDGGNNKTNYENPEYDKVIEEAISNYHSLAARFESLQNLEVIVLKDDAVIAPLFQGGHAVLQKKYVKNFIEHPFGPAYSLKWVFIDKKY